MPDSATGYPMAWGDGSGESREDVLNEKSDAVLAAPPAGGSAVRREASRELNALVAEMVMGWSPMIPEARLSCGWYRGDGQGFPPLPHFSGDISAAWRVVEKMRERKAAFVLGSNGCAAQVSAWFTDGIWALAKNQNRVPEHGDPNLLGAATADTAPLAICLAALKAIEAKEPTA